METSAIQRAPMVAGDVDDSGKAGVSWAAVFAGAAGTAALSYILVILGFGLGLSSISPWATAGIGVTALSIATILWLTGTQIAASAFGGYLAGRLRVRWANVHGDEVHFRDTAHGFLSWAVASLVVAAFLASALGSLVSGTASVAGAAVATTGAGAGAAALKMADGVSDPTGYFVDMLFRADPASTASVDAGEPAARNEAGRIVAMDVASGALAPADKRYLGQVVAKRTGIPAAEAEQRVDATFASLKQSLDDARNKAREAADQTRKATAGAALWMFISLLAGAFFGSFSATIGGRHRETYVPMSRAAVR